MEFLSEYGMFLAKTATLSLFILVTVAAIVFMSRRARAIHEAHLEVKHLNKSYDNMALALQSAMLPRKAFKRTSRALTARRKEETRSKQKEARRRVFVLTFKGDIRASAVASLREEITAVLMVATPKDEVVVLLESRGGIVHGYGLGASQLARVKAHKVPITVAVDHLAASGGYMMACVADKIIAAPFAILGSIGVLGQLPNFHRLLKNNDIDYELHTAGDYKRKLTVFGENTEEDRARFREEIEDTHTLFKEFVKENRGQVDVETVATGDHWYGLRALDLKLVDELSTSDDYLRQASESADLYQVTYTRKRPWLERLSSSSVRWVERQIDPLSLQK